MTLPLYSVILILYVACFGVHIVQTENYYFSDFCNKNIDVSYGANMAGSVQATRSQAEMYQKNRDCTFSLWNLGEGIVLSVENIYLRQDAIRCVDNITILRWIGNQLSVALEESCDVDYKPAFAHDGSMEINFKTGNNQESILGKGFRIHYIAYYKPPCSKPNSFKCSNYDICISKNLTCNGVNNCVDNSDESDNLCGNSSGTGKSSGNVGAIVGGVIGGLIFLVLVAVIVTILYRRQRGRTTSQTNLVHPEQADANQHQPPDGSYGT